MKSQKLKVYLGADHRGFGLKEKIARWLFESGREFTDLGADILDPKDDYPIYAERVASMVANNKNSLGILLCGSGVGVEVAANKIDGVRAGIGKSPGQVKAGRNDDNMNILVLAADFTEDEEAKRMVEVFLKTKFEAKERFKKRIEDIKRLEANN